MADSTVADVAAEDAAEREAERAGMTIADLDERRRDLEDSIAAQTVKKAATDRPPATRDEAIRRMCQLQAEVARAVFGSRRANDCFCNEDGQYDRGWVYRSSGEAIAYIERVVTLSLIITVPIYRFARRVESAWSGLVAGWRYFS